MPANLNHDKLLEKSVEIFTSQIFEISHKFSQTLLWGSGGAISLSLATVESRNNDYGTLFVTAIFCFLLTILLVSTSWIGAQQAIKNELIGVFAGRSPLESRWRKVAEFSTYAASIIFFIGVVLLSWVFLFTTDMSNNNDGQGKSNQRGESGQHSRSNEQEKHGGSQINKHHETKFVMPPLPTRPNPPSK